MKSRENARRHLDARLAILNAAPVARPPRGWIRAIREAVGMSSTELAARMGVTQSRIPAIERAEVEGGIQLDTLRRTARALDCELVYALVPRTSLSGAVHQQARRKAEEHLRSVGHHMRLEDQEVGPGDREDSTEELARQLIDRRGLWSGAALVP